VDSTARNLVKTRILRPDEWSRLGDVGLGELLLYVEPQNITIVVVEDDDGEIIACVSALRITHFEGLWVAPKYRGNPGVSRSLIRYVYAVPRTRGERWAFGGAANGDERMDTLCSRLGGKELPMRLYAMPVGD
jgi:hypothetical protein